MRTVTFILILLFNSLLIYAQSHMNCGHETNPEANQLNNSENQIPCFDIEEVWEDCTTIWVRVNVHFFLDDNCGGGIQPQADDDYISPSQGFFYAEELINSANAMFDTMDENGNVQWQVDPEPEHFCIPIS